MTLRSRRTWWNGFALALIGIGVGWTFAQPDSNEASPDPLTLLPQGSLLLLSSDGHAAHSEGWEQTAAHQAIDDSGLTALMDRTLDGAEQLAEQQGAGPVAAIARQFLGHVRQHGLSFAATVIPPDNGPPTGYAILVLHQAAEFETPISQFVQGASQGELEFQTIEQHGRQVTFTLIPDSPGVEVGWWRERGHLVIVAGIDAVGSSLAVITGEAPNVTSHPLHAKYVAADHGFEAVTRGWLDFASIREMVSGIPLPVETGPNAPGPLTVGEVIRLLGFNNLNSIVSVSGYKGPALWSETWVDAPGKRTGLLGLLEGEPVSFDDLPPMPVGMNSFTATRFDWAKLYDELLSAAYLAARYHPQDDAAQQIDAALEQVREALGMDVRNDLLAHLGGVICGYDDSRQGLFNMGAGFLVKLKDPAAFKAGFDQLLATLENRSEGVLTARRVERQGRELTLVAMAPAPYGQAFCIDGDWLVLGSPQVIESYLLRLDGKLPRWTPSPEHLAAMEAMPAEFSSIAMSDPRGFINLIAGLAPVAIGLAEVGLKTTGEFPPDFSLPIRLEDFPPAELISLPLFPNVSTMQVTPEGMHSQSRTSLPGIPLIGSGDAMTTTAVVAVGAALLLPAVQQARMAARRAQSQNNLKQLALGMHNYHDTHNRLPAGTVLNSDLQPDARLSWMVELLPFIEQAAAYDRIDRSVGWAAGDNLQLAATVITTFVNPAVAEGETTLDTDLNLLGVTHYVGIGGLGEDGPNLKVKDPGAGMFGYDRRTRFADVTDGLSNTLMMSEATGDYGGWMQGGRATIRPFTQQPYINGPDGIGGPYPGGVNMSFSDGATRFVSENIDATVLEAITTIAGGEAVGEF